MAQFEETTCKSDIFLYHFYKHCLTIAKKKIYPQTPSINRQNHQAASSASLAIFAFISSSLYLAMRVGWTRILLPTGWSNCGA